MFTTSNPYDLKRMFQMKENCSNCELKYMIEPAFFYGAMYASYGLTVALGVATYVLTTMFFDPTIFQIIGILMGVLIVTSPIILRLSRIIWMNIFIKYNPDKRGVSFK